MEIYDEEWATNYERLADAGIAGREGLYRLCRAFLMRLPENAHILVVGCGTGEDLVPLATAMPSASFTALEPAEPMFRFCSKRVASNGLSERVELKMCSLNQLETGAQFDAATAIFVSQDISPDPAVQVFFNQISALLKPGGLLYSADLYIADGQDRNAMLRLWRRQAIMSGTAESLVDKLLDKFNQEQLPRDEKMIDLYLKEAGFTNILKPFSSLIYGAWGAEKYVN
jgi:tRNA (cmo5U34)-methyltransferase